jgi:hypothetical protein
MRRRAIKLKSSHLRCLVGEGGGVGTNIGGDCAGAKEPLDIVVESGCEGAKRVLGVVACAGVAVPELLPIESGGVLCPPLVECATGELDSAITGGGGVEVFTMGSAGEEGVDTGERLEGLGVMYVAISSTSTG